MTDHINVFEPYASKMPHHEDCLTRAFLVVIRGVPGAHGAWLALVDRGHRAAGGSGLPSAQELGPPTVRTQTAEVGGHAKRVISLVQTDEVYFREGQASVSDRRQVLDGVVTYGAGLSIVVENKPRRKDIWEGQLDFQLPPGVERDKATACVTWKEVILAWNELLAAKDLGPAETVMVGDFLDYVEENFSRLLPYSKVQYCATNIDRLKRRCKMVLVSLAGDGSVQFNAKWPSWYFKLPKGGSAEQVALRPIQESDGVSLIVEIDPGDSIRQARRLYADCDLRKILTLLEHGWTVKPNLHLAFMTSDLVKTSTALSLEEFWRFWMVHPELIAQVPRARWIEVFDRLVTERLAAGSDREGFDANFVATRRKNFNLCPGITLRWKVSLERAALLDERKQLEGETKEAIERAASTLGLKLPW